MSEARSFEKRLDRQSADRMPTEEGWLYMTGMQALLRCSARQ